MVEDELAYGMESIGLAPDVMRRRVEETLDLLGLADRFEPRRIDLGTADGRRFAARRAILADCGAPALLLETERPSLPLTTSACSESRDACRDSLPLASRVTLVCHSSRSTRGSIQS